MNVHPILTLGCLLISFALQAQTADEVLEAYFEHAGGLRKWKKLETVKMYGILPSPQGEVGFVLYRKAPDRERFEVKLHGGTIIPRAFDGETAWSVSPLMGGGEPRKLPADIASNMAESTEFQNVFINYQEKGHQVTYEGVDTLSEIQAYVIKIIRHTDGEPVAEYHYFDTASYMPVLIKITIPSGNSRGKLAETYLGDYKKTKGGLMMPYYIETRLDGQTVSEMVVQKIEINKKMPDELFAFPEEGMVEE